MSVPRVGKARVMTGVLVSCVAALWTWGASVVLAVALFTAADSRCNGQPPRVDMDGGWLVIATVCVWAAPFVAVAVRRTSVVSVIASLITIVVGVVIVVNMFRSPGTFCF